MTLVDSIVVVVVDDTMLLVPFCDGLDDFEAGPLVSVVVFATVLILALVEPLGLLLSVLFAVDAEVELALDEFGAPAGIIFLWSDTCKIRHPSYDLIAKSLINSLISKGISSLITCCKKLLIMGDDLGMIFESCELLNR